MLNNYSILSSFFTYFSIYNDDPNPEYDPYMKTASTLNTATPPTSAINQRGIRLFVSAINKILIISKLVYFKFS